MTEIIDAQDLAVYLKRTIEADSDEEAAANEIIDGLEADLEAFLKRPIVPRDIVDEAVKATPTGKAFLSATPVIEISAFTYGGAAITAYAHESYGLSGLSTISTPPSISGPVVYPLISYRGGLPGDDPTSTFGKKARAVLLRAAGRSFNWNIRQDLAGIDQASVEGTSMTRHGSGGSQSGEGTDGGFTQRELEGFTRWKRRKARR